MANLKGKGSNRKDFHGQCSNCVSDLTAEYIDCYILAITKKTVTVYEALQTVFKGYEHLVTKDQTKFCKPCGNAFCRLWRSYNEVLKLSTSNSLIQDIVNGLPHLFDRKPTSGTTRTPVPLLLPTGIPPPTVLDSHWPLKAPGDASSLKESESNHGSPMNSNNSFNPDDTMDMEVKKSKSKTDDSESEEDLFNSFFKPKKKKPSKCDVCEKLFDHYWQLKIHKETEHDKIRNIPCGCCDLYFKNVKSLRRHEKIRHQISRKNNPPDDAFKCDICGDCFKHHYHLVMHKEADHEGIRKFRCALCVSSFKKSKSLIRHERLVHQIRRMKSRNECWKKDLEEDKKALLVYEEYKCDTEGCESAALSSFKEWVLHQKDIHGLDTGYKDVDKEENLVPKNSFYRPCPTCGLKLKSNVAMIRHIKVNHTTERPFECSFCKKGFISQKDLNNHITLHTDSQEYLCNLCGAILKTRSGMKQHEETHYGKAPKPALKFECDICHMKVRSKVRLQEHMADAHSDEAPYQCDQCEKKFKIERKLRLHRQYQHVDVVTLPFSCPLCDRRFPQKARVKSHLMSAHNLSKEEAESAAEIKRKIFRILPNGDRVYKPSPNFKSKTCEFCGRSYARLEFLYTHLVQEHGKTEEEAKVITKLETKRVLIKTDDTPSTRTRKRKASTTTETVTSSSSSAYYQNYEQQQQFGHNYHSEENILNL